MTVELYTLEELIRIGEAAVKSELPELDPSVDGSFIRTLVVSNAILIYAAQRNITAAQKDFFPQTAGGEFLDFWAGINALTRIPGTVAEGRIVITGTLAVSIPLGTIFASTLNASYISTSAVAIAAHVGSVTLSKSGTTITAVTPVVHSLVDGLSVVISGAVDNDYNGAFTNIVVLDQNTFTYVASSEPAAATDTGAYSSEFADIPVASQDIGTDKNLGVGALMTLQSTVTGVDTGTQGTVNRDGITGGSDLESDDSLRERVLLANSIDPGVFTNAQIRLDALTIPTATRVFITNPSLSFTTDGTDVGTIDTATREALTGRSVTSMSKSSTTITALISDTSNLFDGSIISIGGANETEYNTEHTITGIVANTSFTFEVDVAFTSPITGTIIVAIDVLKNIPQPGIVYVFVLDDDNDPPTPSSTTLTNVKDKIIEKLPAHTPEASVVVAGPFFESVDVTITDLAPDTTAMRAAVSANLTAYFQDTATFAEDIKVNGLISAIQNTEDLESGQFVDSFTLTSPTVDTTVGNGSMGILGTVTFA